MPHCITYTCHTVSPIHATLYHRLCPQVSCCGVANYQDWFQAGYLDGRSVPDSCCLLPGSGCGRDVDTQDAEDVIDTEVSVALRLDCLEIKRQCVLLRPYE